MVLWGWRVGWNVPRQQMRDYRYLSRNRLWAGQVGPGVAHGHVWPPYRLDSKKIVYKTGTGGPDVTRNIGGGHVRNTDGGPRPVRATAGPSTGGPIASFGSCRVCRAPAATDHKVPTWTVQVAQSHSSVKNNC